MRLPKNQPFWTSVMLHLVVLVGLFLATMLEALRPKEKAHVFEMVSATASEQSTEPSSAQPAPPEPVPDVPMPELPPVPDLVTPEPQPQPQATEASPPEPAPERPQMISREEFIKQYGEPKPRQAPRQSTPRQDITVPQIDVPKLVVPAKPSPSTPGPQQLTSADRSALGTYSSQLRARIDKAWGKPEGLAGLQIAATVVFEVSARGRISNVRLKPRSGNASFDRSVLAAFQRITSAGPTPTGQTHVFTMTLRMAE